MSINQNDLLSEFNENIKFNYNLKKRNWFNIGGNAKIFYKAINLKELIKFLNLIKNASEVQPNSGKIRLRTYFEHNFKLRRVDGSGPSLPITVEVMDNGPGLPEDMQDEIFDPFVSGRANGTGLGLALTSKIILDHNGLISLNSKPGNTVFRISLPFVSQPD